MELTEGKEYWIKAKFKLNDGSLELPYLFTIPTKSGISYWYEKSVEVAEVIPEREKVVLYRPVADWLTACKDAGDTLQSAISEGIEQNPDGISGWLRTHEGQDTFARAWLDGFDLEGELLYWVRNKEGMSLLYRDGDFIYQSSGLDEVAQEREQLDYTFTELEIKGYDERFWAFAVPVEEDDEI